MPSEPPAHTHTHNANSTYQQAERRAAEEEARREKEKEEALRSGNPLLAIAGGGGGAGGSVDFGVKRRWDEDVVFKNTTRGEVKVRSRTICSPAACGFCSAPGGLLNALQYLPAAPWALPASQASARVHPDAHSPAVHHNLFMCSTRTRPPCTAPSR